MIPKTWDADLAVTRFQDVLAMTVVRRHLVEEHRLGALDLRDVDERLRIERARLLVDEAERVFEHHVAAAGFRGAHPG